MDNDSELKESIIDFVNSNFLMGTNSVKFGENDSFLEKGIVDSTGVLEMVSFVQSKFGIMVEDRELVPENLDSVSNLTAYIKRKKTKGS